MKYKKEYLSLLALLIIISVPMMVMAQYPGIKINTGASITTTGSSIISINNGSFSNDGSFIVSDENEVILNGNTIREIGGSSTTTFNDLTINNTEGVYLTGQIISVKRILLSNGVLDAGGRLVILSTTTGTGLIDGSGTGVVSGNLTMQRYLPSMFGYKYFSSPLLASTVYEFTDESVSSVYRYDENRYVGGVPALGWINYDNQSNPLVPMEGYAIHLGSGTGEMTVDVTGEVNNGPVSIPVYNNNQVYTHGFNLCGNPYPSPVDWNLIKGLNTNVDDAVYYFKASATDEYGGTYSTFINGMSSDGLATSIIPSMQGFFVHVADGAWPVTGSLAMNNNVRINNLNQPFIKSGSSVTRQMMRLSTSYANTPEMPDYMVLYFNDGATYGFEGSMDALKLMNTDYQVPSIYSLTPGSVRLSVSAVPPLHNGSSAVPLGLKLQTAGSVTFALPAVDPALEVMTICLVDSVEGKITELRNNNKYTVYLTPGEYNNRFYISFNYDITSAPETNEEPDIFNAGSKNGLLWIYVNRMTNREGHIVVHEISGRRLYAGRLSEPGYHEIIHGLTDGVYIISYRSGNINSTKKIALVN
jgi:fibronectin-binding autotransporter adhesin